jgi:hypothetical protein
VTYEGFAAAWPTMTDEVGFADKMNSMPKYVVSTTLEEPLEWNNSTPIKECRGRSLQPQAAAGRRHPGQRQRAARAHADGTRPDRRIPADGLSSCSREWKASLRKRKRCYCSATRGIKAGWFRRRTRPYLPADAELTPSDGRGTSSRPFLLTYHRSS